MKAWIYRHPVLAVLLPYLPIGLGCEALVFLGYLAPWIGMLASVSVFILLFYGVRRVQQGLFSEMYTSLEQDLDPARFMELSRILKSRKTGRPSLRLMLESNYAAGMDAAGQYEEALSYMDMLARERGLLDPYSRIQFDICYASIAVHSPRGRERALRVVESAERELAMLPPAFSSSLRRALDSVRDAMRYYADDLSGLVEKYVAQIEHCRQDPMQRRHQMVACNWLARVYEKLGRRQDAAAMYGYVVKNGGTLGIVSEAKEAICRVTAEENTPPSTAVENQTAKESASSTEKENAE